MKCLFALIPKAHPYGMSVDAGWYDRMIGPGLILAVFLFISGIVIPVASVDKLLFFTGSYSILTFVQVLFQEGNFLLALVITLFSIVFPFVKLLQAIQLWWFIDRRSARIASALRRLEVLGKWSMMDVFIVSLGIVVATSTNLANMTPRIGIYLFGVSVILTMIAVGRMERLAHRISNGMEN